MAANSSIEWTQRTWNPVVGCTKVSPGCAHCYAETMANRLKGMAIADKATGRDPGRKRHYIKVIDSKGRWNGKLAVVPEALDDPYGWKKPTTVFVNSMSDLFHESLPFRKISAIFTVMAQNQQHTFQILTKRADRLLEFYEWNYGGMTRRDSEEDWLANWSNVWFGVSVERQKEADERIPLLLQVPAAVRFLSCEPLLGPIRIDHLSLWNESGFSTPREVYPLIGTMAIPDMDMNCGAINWVIVGGESGPAARTCDLNWIRSIVEQCKAAEVPCFVKQLGGNLSDEDLSECARASCRSMHDSKGGDPSEWPADLRVREMPKLPVHV